MDFVFLVSMFIGMIALVAIVPIIIGGGRMYRTNISVMSIATGGFALLMVIGVGFMVTNQITSVLSESNVTSSFDSFLGGTKTVDKEPIKEIDITACTDNYFYSGYDKKSAKELCEVQAANSGFIKTVYDEEEQTESSSGSILSMSWIMIISGIFIVILFIMNSFMRLID